MQKRMARLDSSVSVEDGSRRPSEIRPRALPGTPEHAARCGSRGATDLPICTRETVGADGRSLRVLYVFCPREERTRAPEACAESDASSCKEGVCGACGLSMAERPAAAPFAPPLVARTPIGMVMGDIRCVRFDAPLAQVSLPSEGGPIIVVDPGGVPMGALRNPDLPLVSHARASDLMMPILTIDQRDRFTDAVARMVTRRARHACVVDHDHVAIGLVSDVSVLQWLARRRQALAEDV